VGMAKSSYFYKPRERKPRPLDPVLEQAIKDMAGTREDLSCGYHKKTQYLDVRGLHYNEKKVYRHLKVYDYLISSGGNQLSIGYWRSKAGATV
jgi:hypothetical protein